MAADCGVPNPSSQSFSYFPTGDLEPGSGSGTSDPTVYMPGMVFPIADHASYLNTQVYSLGGSAVGGDQCDARNYDYPWRNNFCETRSSERNTLNCPQDNVHQGQDIRAGSPQLCQQIRQTSPNQRTQIPVVAIEDGVISYVGSYTVNLRASGRITRYMHMNMDALQVERGDQVQAGQVIGFLSNDFGGTPTTFHLHLEFNHNIDGAGWTYVNPYTSLVRAYERCLGKSGVVVTDQNNFVTLTGSRDG